RRIEITHLALERVELRRERVDGHRGGGDRGRAEASLFLSPSGNLECSMQDNRQARRVNCSSGRAPQRVEMGVSGALTICKGRRCVPTCGCKEENASVLAYGRQLTVGRFRCISLESCIKCTVIQSGQGFLINRTTIARVGA